MYIHVFICMYIHVFILFLLWSKDLKKFAKWILLFVQN